MASQTLTLFRSPLAAAERARPHQPSKPGLLLRLVRMLMESRRRAAEREVARFIEMRGGKLTDELERQIGRQLF